MIDPDRYKPMLIEERPLHELYGFEEALEDFLDAATAPMRDDAEYREAREVVIKVALPSVIFEGAEEFRAGVRQALEGGRWGGDRRRDRRLKLRRLIQLCAEYLGEADPTASFPEGWEHSRLYYGYYACSKYAKMVGLPQEDALLLGLAKHVQILIGKTGDN